MSKANKKVNKIIGNYSRSTKLATPLDLPTVPPMNQSCSLITVACRRILLSAMMTSLQCINTTVRQNLLIAQMMVDTEDRNKFVNSIKIIVMDFPKIKELKVCSDA